MRRKYLFVAAAIAVLGSSTAFAATVEQIATLAKGRASLEALAENPDGSMWLTSNFDHALVRVSPEGKELQRITTPLATQVVVRGPNGVLIVTGHERVPAGVGGPPPAPAPGAAPTPPAPPNPMRMVGLGTGIVVIDAKSGKLLKQVSGPQDSFFNGLSTLTPGLYVVADSIGGKLWQYDLAKNTVTPWLEDVSVEGPGGKPSFGGSNGLKVHKGYVYYTSRGSMWRVKIGKNYQAEGKPEEFAKIGGDDFDFGKDGYAYIPQGRNLMKVSPTGEITQVVELGFNAPTAMFAKDGKLYLLTRGIMPAGGGEAESKIARVTLP